MSNDLEDLARRAVAAGWLWRGGCRAWWRGGVYRVSGPGEGGLTAFRAKADGTLPGFADALPDLTDLATLGCLEGLVIEALGVEVFLSPEWHEGQRWWVPRRESNDVACGPGGRTKAHALVAALEAAPAKVAP